MAISVTGLTVHTQTGGGTWTDYGTGGGSGDTTDNFFSSTSARGRKFSGVKGMGYQVNATGTDLSNSIIVIRYLLNGGYAATLAADGGVIRLEDTSGNQSDWTIDGSDTYQAGWKVVVIDTANAETANSGTAASLTAIQYVGMVVNANGASGGDDNFYIDEVLSLPNTGLTLGGNTTNLFDELADFDETSLYGIVERRSGIIFSKSPLIMSPDASDHASTDEVLIFEEPIYEDGTNIDSALTLQGLSSADTDTITLTRLTAVCDDNSDITGTNADKELDFASATDIVATNSVFRGFNGTTVALGGSGNDYTGVTFQGCSEVVDTGAVLRDCVFRNTTSAAGAYEWDEQTDMQDCTFESDGTGHGVHFTHNSATNLTGVSAITLDNIEFIGYGATDTADAGIDVDPDTASIDVDFNVINGGTVTTLDTRSPYTGTATITATVAVSVTAQEADGTKIQDARVRLEAAPGGDLPSDDVVTITTSGTTATVTHTAHGLSTNDFVLIRGANEVELTGRNQITVTGVNTYTYTITSIGGASGTGTITSTSSILSDFTDVNGVVEDTGFNYTTDQPVRGTVRKGTTSPFYKQFPLSGTITNAGLAITAILTPDE